MSIRKPGRRLASRCRSASTSSRWRGDVRALLLAICALILTSAFGFAQDAPAPAPGQVTPGQVTGRAAIDKVIGNTMSGTIENEAYFAYYDKDGTVRMLVGGNVSHGKWSIDGNNLCEEFPDDEDETCYHFQIDDAGGIMTDEDGTDYKIEIIKGNPKKL